MICHVNVFIYTTNIIVLTITLYLNMNNFSEVASTFGNYYVDY